MAGGGGGNPFRNRTPEQMRSAIRREERNTIDVQFAISVGEYLGNLLGRFNGRDVALVRTRIDDAKAAVQEILSGTFDQIFGGSVAKHTYVDGLSDIDALLLLNDTELDEQTPRGALRKLKRALEGGLNGVDVTVGRMAVTLTYPDGMEIQLLPAMRAGTKIMVPSARTEGWSKIDPDKFREALTRRNTECGGKLVPTIKLAKAILGNLQAPVKISGYHVESLAIAAFRGYSGTKSTVDMLPHFFEKARNLILQPIRDSTGQSIHVDEYLGSENSRERQLASHLLARIAKRIRSANLSQSMQQWRDLFDGDF